ncbi:histidinol-phosphatase [Duncaniella muricolitica]|uniref:histidinol-phosphatase n=1 Tax=Duncaniella muricolitica TaxID=2880704 RepID=UPI00244DC320|nr:histidinol-phosphatase [Duncaniella muricolitica]
MNLHEIISTTRDYNFHSHTQFCDGRESMARMAGQALACGMKHYGFTPHSPIPLPSSCNMSALVVPDYVAEFQRLKELYAGRINLYLSMEIDYLGDRWGATNPYFDTIPLDYRLSSVHFVSTPDGEREVDVDGRPQNFRAKMAEHFDNDIHYVVDSFYARTLAMIEKGGFDILGHFDKIGFNASSFSPGIENEPWYRRHIDNVIDAVRATDIIVEINTKAYPAPVGSTLAQEAVYEPRLFPSPDVIRRLVSAGLPLAVNSDAHYSSRITAGRAAAFAIIDE